MRALLLSLILLAIPAIPAIGSAAEPSKQKQAELHFNEAQKLYNAGDYEHAVKEFLQAYTLVPVNPLLFNIGQAYRRAGDKEKALSYYEKYVSFEPGGAQVGEAKDYIRDLKQQVQTEQREKDQAEADRLAKEEEDRKAREEADRKRAEAELARKRAELQGKGSGLRVGGLVIGGIGIVALGVGVALGVSDTFDGKAIGLAAGGGALLVTGGIMYFVGVKQRRDAEGQLKGVSLVVPQVTGSTVGVAWILTF